jgi:SAM-dependent methyltransferase
MRDILHRIGSRLGVLPRPHLPAGVECGPEWYDRAFTTTATYHDHYSRSAYYALWAIIVDRVRRAKLKRVLEIGCGPGQLAAFLLDQGVESYLGLDFSPTAIELARAAAREGRFVVGDARTSEVYSQFEHDAIICTEVLEHIEDDLAVVSRFGPGKRCLCTVPNFPYDSHVRHFIAAEEVGARYGRFFGHLDVAIHQSPVETGVYYFLFDGVRNEVTDS